MSKRGDSQPWRLHADCYYFPPSCMIIFPQLLSAGIVSNYAAL